MNLFEKEIKKISSVVTKFFDKQIRLYYKQITIGAIFGLLIGLLIGGVADRLIASMVGAFTGASAAFLLQNHREKNKIRSEQIAIANMLIIMLNRFRSNLFEIHNKSDEMLKGMPSEKLPDIKDVPMFWMSHFLVPQSYYDLKIDIENLEFLLKCSNPNILLDLISISTGYEGCMLLIDKWNKLHIDEIQPAIERNGLLRRINESEKPYKNVEILDELFSILGERIFYQCMGYSEDILKQVKDGIDNVEDTYTKLIIALSELLPIEKIIKLEFDICETKKESE